MPAYNNTITLDTETKDPKDKTQKKENESVFWTACIWLNILNNCLCDGLESLAAFSNTILGWICRVGAFTSIILLIINHNNDNLYLYQNIAFLCCSGMLAHNLGQVSLGMQLLTKSIQFPSILAGIAYLVPYAPQLIPSSGN